MYTSKDIRGKLCSDIQWIIYRDKGRVFQTGCIFSKIYMPVLEFLRSKDPDTRPPIVISFEAYGGTPLATMPMDITDETVDFIA